MATDFGDTSRVVFVDLKKPTTTSDCALGLTGSSSKSKSSLGVAYVPSSAEDWIASRSTIGRSKIVGSGSTEPMPSSSPR